MVGDTISPRNHPFPQVGRYGAAEIFSTPGHVHSAISDFCHQKMVDIGVRKEIILPKQTVGTKTCIVQRIDQIRIAIIEVTVDPVIFEFSSQIKGNGQRFCQGKCKSRST